MTINLVEFIKNKEITIHLKDIKTTLELLNQNLVSENEVSNWASKIELSDFIDYNNRVGTCLNYLANPELEGGMQEAIKLINTEIHLSQHLKKPITSTI